jgi:hypothetical protein
MLQSCQNCWFNGLQYGGLGLAVGYCSRHQKILFAADATTCGQHMRKDLSCKRAREVSVVHLKHYTKDAIVSVFDSAVSNVPISSAEKDLKVLRADPVAESVSDYGLLGSKIESLAQLNGLTKEAKSARAEVAMMSLARGYVQNCFARDKTWTSGLHLYWWTKNRLPELPSIEINDIRTTNGIELARQIDLTAWSVMMLRLTLIDDVVECAAVQGDAIGEVKGLLQKSAEAIQTFNLPKLSKWMKTEAQPALDRKLSEKRYRELSNALHKVREDGA